ncbi:diacylglycerol kinase theta [Lethenteron reissneri]|uniref:diacylglycerol kinase theta n=1 Tax=Lethenteron reissneri TaxID=7753 RepID=UPI002AB65D68|nr:diacylglycerol kinase theta [Lethenteron reissneri]
MAESGGGGGGGGGDGDIGSPSADRRHRPRASSAAAVAGGGGAAAGGAAGGDMSPRSRHRLLKGGSHGHCFRKVTLTKPTFCQHCTDFVWGIVGYQCEVCKFMSHEKCLKSVVIMCSTHLATCVKVPVAHCFTSPGQYKKKFCNVCRRHLEDSLAYRCEVCDLHLHADCMQFACSDCRQCNQERPGELVLSIHHWREGNMPSGSRCEVCRKACSSSEALCSMRCGWCGLTVHSGCCSSIPPECSFGRLHSLVLPPNCVRLYGNLHLQETIAAEADGGGSQPGPLNKDSPVNTPETGKQKMKVFDGDEAARAGRYHTVSVPRISRTDDVVEAALREYFLPGNPTDYELRSLSLGMLFSPEDSFLHGNGHLGDDPGTEGDPGNQQFVQVFRDTLPEAYVIRAKRSSSEVVKIYADWLCKGVAYVSFRIDESHTVRSVITEVLLLLGRKNESPDDYRLTEVMMHCKEVQRRVLVMEQSMLDHLHEIRKLSVQRINLTRFYITAKLDGDGNTQLLVGGLPPGLAAPDYLSLLRTHVKLNENTATITQIYSKQGAVALEVSSCAEAERLFRLANDSKITVDDKIISINLLPTLIPEQMPRSCHPLLVLINPRSGGMQGRELLHSFRKAVNPHQVFDLACGGPLPGLHVFREVPRFRLLVCGGDGTVGWVLSLLEDIKLKLACTQPPVAILPLGTGNDLARVLRWGPGYSGEDPLSVLINVDEAQEVKMDRWTILLDANEPECAQERTSMPRIVQMNNYFGIGVDADLSLGFHNAREEDPGKFNSRLHNKSVYVKVGLQKITHNRNLHRDIKVQVDNVDIDLPSVEGLIFLNIPSWGSGADLWGSDSEGKFSKPCMHDGLLEVVGVTGVMHMGQVQGGLRSGIRIAQGQFIRVVLQRETPIQVDGEPWLQPPGNIIVSAGPQVSMLKKSKQRQKKGSQREARGDSTAAADD